MAPLLVALAACGSAGAVAATVGRDQSRYRSVAIVFSTGGVAACAAAGFMSIGPYALAALILFEISMVIEHRGSCRNVVYKAAGLALGFLVWFMPLLCIVTRVGVDRVGIPEDSALNYIFPGPDYEDAFRIELPAHFAGDVDLVAHSVARSMRPSWMGKVRPKAEEALRLNPGSALGHWPVHLRRDDEIVLGLDRSFIDLRLSLILRQEESCFSVTASTAAQYDNWVGRLYFIPVRYGHQIVLADTMRKTRVMLMASPHGEPAVVHRFFEFGGLIIPNG